MAEPPLFTRPSLVPVFLLPTKPTTVLMLEGVAEIGNNAVRLDITVIRTGI